MPGTSKRRRQKALYVAGVILLPLLLVFFVWTPDAPDPGLVLDRNALNYPAAVLSLRSTSELLVTVAMAVLGAIGLLMVRLRRSSPLIVGLAATGFIGALMSIFFACRVGFNAAITLAAPGGNVEKVTEMLNNQAMATLLAGLSLAAIAVLEAFPEEE